MGEGDKYDQNILYEILEELIKVSFKGREEAEDAQCWRRGRLLQSNILPAEIFPLQVSGALGMQQVNKGAGARESRSLEDSQKSFLSFVAGADSWTRSLWPAELSPRKET